MSSELYEALDKDPGEALPLVRKLLNRRVEVNEEFPRQVFENPLYMAAKKQNPEVIELLLDHGAEINALTAGNMPPLMAAVVHGQVENCKVLLERGADAHIRIHTGESMLELAVLNQKLAVVKLLLDHGIDVNMKGSKGGTVIDAAIRIDHAEVIFIGDMEMQRVVDSFSTTKLDIMRLLIDNGINIDARPVDDGTSLHTATYVGDIRTIKILLDAGADPNIVDDCNRKPLWAAVRQDRMDIVRLLLPRTNNINDQVYNGHTCLSTAARWGLKKSVKRLLETGAEIWSREPGPQFLEPERRMTWYGLDALCWAVENGDEDVVRMILAAGAERPSIEPEFRRHLEVWDRAQPQERERVREWIITRHNKSNTPEHKALRTEMSEKIDIIREEKNQQLAEEFGLPIVWVGKAGAEEEEDEEDEEEKEARSRKRTRSTHRTEEKQQRRRVRV